MARLIVEDDGRRRAFRVNEGKLSIGSGAGCTLTLTAADVADVHAELELAGGRATLIPRPGVVAPQVDGRPVSSRVVLADGARIAIGKAQLVYQMGDAPAATPAARSSAPARAAAAPVAPVTPVAAGAARQASARVSRAPQRARKGAPVWLVLLGIAIALVIVGAVWAKTWKKGATGFDPAGRYQTALTLQQQGSLLQAEQELAKLRGVELSPELARNVAQLEQAIADAHTERELRFEHEEGSDYLETQLKRFERERLQGAPPHEVVRLFLLRCREFRERWPAHPEIDWVDRYEARFRGQVDLSAPPSYKDIAYEIESLTWAKPRDYEKAFGLLDVFVDRASGSEREQALALSDKLVRERAEYFEDRMLQAKFHWEKDERGQAVEWLAQVVMKIGDDALAAEAAREMLLLPGIETWLRGYKENRPDKWERLLREPSIREYVAEHGL